jgi:hypothetical protein
MIGPINFKLISAINLKDILRKSRMPRSSIDLLSKTGDLVHLLESSEIQNIKRSTFGNTGVIIVNWVDSVKKIPRSYILKTIEGDGNQNTIFTFEYMKQFFDNPEYSVIYPKKTGDHAALFATLQSLTEGNFELDNYLEFLHSPDTYTVFFEHLIGTELSAFSVDQKLNLPDLFKSFGQMAMHDLIIHNMDRLPVCEYFSPKLSNNSDLITNWGNIFILHPEQLPDGTLTRKSYEVVSLDTHLNVLTSNTLNSKEEALKVVNDYYDRVIAEFVAPLLNFDPSQKDCLDRLDSGFKDRVLTFMMTPLFYRSKSDYPADLETFKSQPQFNECFKQFLTGMRATAISFGSPDSKAKLKSVYKAVSEKIGLSPSKIPIHVSETRSEHRAITLKEFMESAMSRFSNWVSRNKLFLTLDPLMELAEESDDHTIQEDSRGECCTIL